MPLDRTQQAHRLAGLVYLLYALGFLFGITAIIGVIFNQANLRKTTGTYAYSHFIWQIISFGVLFAGVVISIILWPGGYGYLTAIGCLLWWISSGLVGAWYLYKRKPLPFIRALTTGN